MDIGAIILDAGATEAPRVFTAGIASESSHTTTTEVIAWTDSQNGNGSVTAQLQQSASGANSWSNVASGTTSPKSVTGLTPGTAYDFRVAYTDATPTTIYSATLSVTTVANGTITITAPSDYRLFQQVAGVADIPVSGTYTVNSGGSIVHVEARWGSGAWTTIDAAPSAGAYSGTLSSQASGQGTLSVRFSNDALVTASSVYVGVGNIYICAGQSNMEGQGTSNQVYTHATLKACLFANDNTWKNLTDPYDVNTGQVDAVSSDASAAGSFVPLLATQLLASNGIPVGFVPCAKSGTSITDWQPGADHSDRTTLYGSMNYRIGLVGGAKEVLWWQSETDAKNAMAQATYDADLDVLANAIQADRGIKLRPVLLQTCTDVGTTQAAQDAINAAIIAAHSDNANILQYPDFRDLTSDDGFHLKTNAHLLTAATRWANAMLIITCDTSTITKAVAQTTTVTITLPAAADGVGTVSFAVNNGHATFANGTFSGPGSAVGDGNGGATFTVDAGTTSFTFGIVTVSAGSTSGTFTNSFGYTNPGDIAITVLSASATLTQATAVPGQTIGGTAVNFTPDTANFSDDGSTGVSVTTVAGVWSLVVPLTTPTGVSYSIELVDTGSGLSAFVVPLLVQAASGAKSTSLALGTGINI